MTWKCADHCINAFERYELR